MSEEAFSATLTAQNRGVDVAQPYPAMKVASAAEGLLYAEDVCSVLKDLAVLPTLWTDEAIFPPGATIVESIEQIARTHDAAILVASPDDKTTKRGKSDWTPRDNIVFESGYFGGSFGRRRAIILKVGDARLPSDLDGVVPIRVEPPSRNADDSYDHDSFRRSLKDKVRPWTKQLRTAGNDAPGTARTLERANYAEQLRVFFGEAPRKILLFGYNMETTLRALVPLLRILVEQPDLEFRALIADPHAKFIDDRARILGINPSTFRAHFEEAQNHLTDLLRYNYAPDKKEARLLSYPPPYSLVRIDDRMLVSPYLYANPRGELPALIFEKMDRLGGLFEKLEQDFQQSWRQSGPLQDPRVSVPQVYRQNCSEKSATARVIAEGLSAASARTTLLDIGCGDGEQARCLREFLPIDQQQSVLIDHDWFAVRSAEGNLSAALAIQQKRWQDYHRHANCPTFNLVLASHVAGTLYRQSDYDADRFWEQIQAMLDRRAQGGSVAIVLASASSVEIVIRERLAASARHSSSNVLSAEKFENLAGRYRDGGVPPLRKQPIAFPLRLDTWLNSDFDAPLSAEELEIFRFLFWPLHGDTKVYRGELWQRATSWNKLSDAARDSYTTSSRPAERSAGEAKEEVKFVELAHVCFWFT